MDPLKRTAFDGPYLRAPYSEILYPPQKSTSSLKLSRTFNKKYVPVLFSRSLSVKFVSYGLLLSFKFHSDTISLLRLMPDLGLPISSQTRFRPAVTERKTTGVEPGVLPKPLNFLLLTSWIAASGNEIVVQLTKKVIMLAHMIGMFSLIQQGQNTLFALQLFRK